MGRRPPCLALLLYLVAVIDCSSDTVITGRCHQKCASEFTKMTVRIRNDRSVASEPLTNSTEFVICRLGCLRIPGFEEHHHSAFHRGRRLRSEIDDTATESTGRSVASVLTGIDFLCAHSPSVNNSRLNVSVALNVEADGSRLIDYHIQVLARSKKSAPERQLHETHVFSTLVTFSIHVHDNSEEVQVRASAYDSMGLVGATVSSRWWPLSAFLPDSSTAAAALKLRLVRQMWHEERAAALVSIGWPDYRIPSCDVRLRVALADASHPHDTVHVQLDESRTALATKLSYEETYAMEAEEVGGEATLAATGSSSILVVTMDACLRMVTDPNMCPPPPVSSLSYRWNSSDTFVVSWSFDQSSTAEYGARRAASHHFLVSVSVHPKARRELQLQPREATPTTAAAAAAAEEGREAGKRDAVCHQQNDAFRKTFTAEIRSAIFRLPDVALECEFEVEVTAVDARNRRSRAVSIDSRQAEMASWQQVENGGIEIALLWAVFIFMCVLGVSVSIMVLRHQQRSSSKKHQLKERDHHRVILDSLYGRDTLNSRYGPAPSEFNTFLTAPSPPMTEVPRGVYRVGRGWSGSAAGAENNTLSCSKDASYASRLMGGTDDGYAICELHDDTIDCQHNLSLFPLPHTDRTLCGVPVYSPTDYDVVELVGRGRFGEVFAARFQQSTTLTALKHFTEASDLQCEFAAARSLCLARSSPYFPALIGVVCPRDSLALSALLYEYCPGGDLRSYLLALRDSLPHRAHLARSLRNVAPRIFCFLRATAASMGELHSRRVVHRDLSTRNVLLTSRWTDPFGLSDGCEAKLADLGLCCPIDGEEGSRRLSLPWQSPQVRQGARYTMEDDVWSFGCVLLEAATLGCEPWNGGALPTLDSGRHEMGRWVEGVGVGHAKIDAALASRLRPLISECLSIDRLARPSVPRILDYLISLNTTCGTLPAVSDLPYYTKDSQFV